MQEVVMLAYWTATVFGVAAIATSWFIENSRLRLMSVVFCFVMFLFFIVEYILWSIRTMFPEYATKKMELEETAEATEE